MQTSSLSRGLAVLVLAVLAGCSGGSGNPYAAIANPPVVQARLHSVILAADSAEVGGQLESRGYVKTAFPSNYPVSNAVESSLWSVPESVVESAVLYEAPAGGGLDVRVLELPLAANGGVAKAGVDQAFYRNVLGTDVPEWPAAVTRTGKVRVQVWTFVIADVLSASKRLRENGVPVVFDPVAITTAYMGDHKAMAIRAPDGTLIELVQTLAQ